jgi:hypothetical protein
MMEMRKWTKTESEDLGFVRKYCLANTYPASDERCPYAKAKIMAKSSEVSTGKSDFKDVDGRLQGRGWNLPLSIPRSRNARTRSTPHFRIGPMSLHRKKKID